MASSTLWVALAILVAALARPADARMCQKPDGTFTDQCGGSDKAVETRPNAVQTGAATRGGAGTGPAAQGEAGGVGPWCREFLALDPRDRLALLHRNNGFDAYNLSPDCVETELHPRLLAGCRAGHPDGIAQQRAIDGAKQECRRARW